MKRPNRPRPWAPGPWSTLLLAFLAASCQDPALTDQQQELPDARWSMADTVSFLFEAPGPEQAFRMWVRLRHNADYPYSNIWLFVRTTAPNGSVEQDTLQHDLALPDGQWLGEGSDPYRLDLLYLPAVRFAMPGTYRFDIVHGMRDPTLQGVEAVGLWLPQLAQEPAQP